MTLTLLVLTSSSVWAGYGWYNGFMSIGGITTDPTTWSTSGDSPTDLGLVTDMTITSIAFSVWDDSNDRGGANMFFRIWDGGSSQIGSDQDIHLGEATRIMGDHDFDISYTGSYDLAAEVGLTLEIGKTYYIDMWAKTYGNSGDEWYSNGGSNYHAKLTIGKNIANCTATLPDQTLSAYSSTYHYVMEWDDIMYKFESANDPTSNGFSVGEEVKDGETVLTLGTDYEFGAVVNVTGNGTQTGDKCRVEIVGKGDYAGSQWVDFTILGKSASGTWGDNLSWNLSDGTLTISGSGAMQATGREDYPWQPYGSNITTIILDDNITSIAAYAFGGTDKENTYAGVTSFLRRTGTEGNYTDTEGLPTKLTSIGDNAFAYCCGATIIIPPSVTTFGTTTPFNEVGYEENGVVKGGVVASISDTGDNSGLITALASARFANVTINRTLYKDGAWNTLCLPFDIANIYVKNSTNQYTCPLYGNGVSLMELDVDNYYDANNTPYMKIDNQYLNGGTAYSGTDPLHQTGLDNGTLYLYFKDATSITAGKPYIIKWNNGNDITSLTFNGVKIEDNTPAVTSTDGNVSFKGSFSPVAFTLDDNSKFFLGSSTEGNKTVSTLYYPNAANNQDGNYYVNAFRAYFQLADGQQARKFVLNLGDGGETSGITTTNSTNLTNYSGTWYTLDGRKLNSKPNTKGLYIHNGRKVAIK